MYIKKGVIFAAMSFFLAQANPVALIDNGKGAAWRKHVFSYIYDSRHWGSDQESASGPGSSLASTVTIRTFLPSILRAIGARRMIDAGCGDCRWMSELIDELINECNLELYLGVDIAEGVIKANQEKYARENVVFMNLDIAEDPLLNVDVIMCRDVLAHLSYEDIHRVLRNFKKSGAKYLLASSFSAMRENSLEMISGNFRSVNLRIAPFNFPEPIISILEMSSEKKMVQYGKHICLWRISDLPIE